MRNNRGGAVSVIIKEKKATKEKTITAKKKEKNGKHSKINLKKKNIAKPELKQTKKCKRQPTNLRLRARLKIRGRKVQMKAVHRSSVMLLNPTIPKSFIPSRRTNLSQSISLPNKQYRDTGHRQSDDKKEAKEKDAGSSSEMELRKAAKNVTREEGKAVSKNRGKKLIETVDKKKVIAKDDKGNLPLKRIIHEEKAVVQEKANEKCDTEKSSTINESSENDSKSKMVGEESSEDESLDRKDSDDEEVDSQEEQTSSMAEEKCEDGADERTCEDRRSCSSEQEKMHDDKSSKDHEERKSDKEQSDSEDSDSVWRESLLPSRQTRRREEATVKRGTLDFVRKYMRDSSRFRSLKCPCDMPVRRTTRSVCSGERRNAAAKEDRRKAIVDSIIKDKATTISQIKGKDSTSAQPAGSP